MSLPTECHKKKKKKSFFTFNTVSKIIQELQYIDDPQFKVCRFEKELLFVHCIVGEQCWNWTVKKRPKHCDRPRDDSAQASVLVVFLGVFLREPKIKVLDLWI